MYAMSESVVEGEVDVEPTKPDQITGMESNNDIYASRGDGSQIYIVACRMGGECDFS